MKYNVISPSLIHRLDLGSVAERMGSGRSLGPPVHHQEPTLGNEGAVEGGELKNFLRIRTSFSVKAKIVPTFVDRFTDRVSSVTYI